MREIRLLPIVTVAAGALLFLKAVGLLSGDFARSGPSPARAQDLAGQAQSLTDPLAPSGIPGLERSDAGLTTGSTPTPAPAAPAAPAPTATPTVRNAATGQPIAPQSTVSAAERAILERLQERRQELDGRQRELDMREDLLRATERRMEQRVTELRELEARITGLEQRRDEAEVTRFRGVVSMYETMRPKDAARIFDSLDLTVLLEVARAMRPPKLADIIAQMQADPAKRLTTELARRPGQTGPTAAVELPKIEGRPTR
ncbi:flagellar protein FlbB [Phreatobacter aquaticus]|uniref:Flagellar protein FlbB n=1 Tax=Phreatobacter aquaticus TaxID=2570229 RepID=A0A4D7QKD2_9HYPH|nr:flagellar protein FlbB [Phreatobacter aquaticus]QCK88068.1 flagellar protein FlbB [Phreatobacter aquaticus]